MMLRSSPLNEQERCVLRQFDLLLSYMIQTINQPKRRDGLNGAKFRALALVQSHSGISVGELARLLGVQQTTVSNLVRALSKAGLVGRRRSQQDQRVVALHITVKGERHLYINSKLQEGPLSVTVQRLERSVLTNIEKSLTILLELLPDSTTLSARVPPKQKNVRKKSGV